MLLVGLTGGIGSGKSTVAIMLAERGAVVVDADQIAREVVEPGGPAYQPMIDRFGAEIVRPDKTLDRAAIAAQAFAGADALADLNAITHPAIRTVMALCTVISGSTTRRELTTRVPFSWKNPPITQKCPAGTLNFAAPW